MTGWAGAALVVLAAASGCGDECQRGDERCDGNRLWVCDDVSQGQDSPTRWGWVELGCDDDDYPVCVEADQDGVTHAFCARSSEPDPECGDPVPGAGVCAGDTALFCQHGHRTWADTCGAPDLCIVVADGGGGRPFAFCALEPEPDPCCPESSVSTPYTGYCVGFVEVGCTFGYKTNVTEPGGTCLYEECSL